MFIKYSVYLDGELIGKIKNDSTLMFKVNEGKHILHLKVLWMKSRSIAFTKDVNNTYFTCGSNIKGTQNLTYSFWPDVENENYIYLDKTSK